MRRPAHLAIVDRSTAGEGDGPITVTPRHAYPLSGCNLPAVDAGHKAADGDQPGGFRYLASASGRPGPIAERHFNAEPIALACSEFPAPRSPCAAGNAGS